MAEIKVRYSQLYTERNEEKIVVSAFQSERFLKVVNKQLKDGFGRKTQRIAQNHVTQAIRNIQQVLGTGISGATSGKKFVSAQDVDGSTMKVGVDFPPLTPKTLGEKRRRNSLGKGKFWLDRGKKHKGRESLRDIAGSINVPKVTYKTKIAPLTLRKAGKGSRVDFTVKLEFDEMNFPFDDMVRRPLIAGGEYTAESEIDSSGPDDKSLVFVYLEYGVGGDRQGRGSIKARGFIRQMSAKLGERMFDRINSN